MRTFPGFPSRPDYVAIPRVFFTDVLPYVLDMAELLVTLHLFRIMGGKRGYPRAVALHELPQDRALVAGFTQLGRDFREEVKRGVEAALARGTFLRVVAAGDQEWLLLNTPQDRRAAGAIQRGEILLPHDKVAGTPVVVASPQRDIFSLYEDTIGLLTPLIAERLQEAEQEYPTEWVREAFQIAEERNQRHWRYVEAILQRWKTEGKDDGKPGGHSKAARDVAPYQVWPNRQRPRT